MKNFSFQKFKNKLNKFNIVVSMADIKIIIKNFFRSIAGTNYKLLRHYKIKNYIYKLNLGCGDTYLEGWLNTDIFPKSRKIFFLDATKKFPFEDNIFSYIFSEHMIEHISYSDAKKMIRECFRVLKKDSNIRIATPDINFLFELDKVKSQINKKYLKFFFDSNKDYGSYEDATFVVNDFMRSHGHLFIYNPQILKNMLEEAGFVDIKFFSINKSNIEIFRNLENETRMPSGLLDLETFAIEGKKTT